MIVTTPLFNSHNVSWTHTTKMSARCNARQARNTRREAALTGDDLPNERLDRSHGRIFLAARDWRTAQGQEAQPGGEKIACFHKLGLRPIRWSCQAD